jgi:hypothetical protein
MFVQEEQMARAGGQRRRAIRSARRRAMQSTAMYSCSARSSGMAHECHALPGAACPSAQGEARI